MTSSAVASVVYRDVGHDETTDAGAPADRAGVAAKFDGPDSQLFGGDASTPRSRWSGASSVIDDSIAARASATKVLPRRTRTSMPSNSNVRVRHRHGDLRGWAEFEGRDGDGAHSDTTVLPAVQRTCSCCSRR